MQNNSGNTNSSVKAVLQFPAFVSENGGHEQEIIFNNVNLDKAEYISEEIWLKSEDVRSADTSIMLKRESVECTINDINVPADDNIKFLISCVYDEPRHLVDSHIGKKNIDERAMAYKYSDICLAQIKINRLSNSYEIVKVIENDVKDYIETPADGKEREEYISFFRSVYNSMNE